MSSRDKASLTGLVQAAAQAALAAQHYVSALDVFAGIDWQPSSLILEWRRGRLPCLQEVLQVSQEKTVQAMQLLREWAEQLALQSEELPFLARTVRDRRELRFSLDGDPQLERSFRTHYFDSTLSENKLAELRGHLTQAPETVVFWLVGDSQCAQCKTALPKGRFLVMEAEQPLCLACAGLDHLVYLGRGDALLTRRAKKYSSVAAVVVRFSRARKQYERQGILVEKEALQLAEQECGRKSQSAPEDFEP